MIAGLLVVFLDLAAELVKIVLSDDSLAAKRRDETLLVIVVDGREEVGGDSALIIGAVDKRDDAVGASALFERDIALGLKAGDEGEDGGQREVTDLLRESLLEEARVNVLNSLGVEVPDALHDEELGSGELAEIGVLGSCHDVFFSPNFYLRELNAACYFTIIL